MIKNAKGVASKGHVRVIQVQKIICTILLERTTACAMCLHVLGTNTILY